MLHISYNFKNIDVHDVMAQNGREYDNIIG